MLLIFTNLYEFKNIDNRANTNYKALYSYQDDNLAHIGPSSSPTVRGKYMSWFALARVAPQSSIIIPRGSLYDDGTRAIISRLYAFGDTHSVEYKEVSSYNTILREFDPIPYVVASGESGRKDSPYFIIAMKKPTSSLRLKQEMRGVFISSKPIRSHTSFIMLDWSDPPRSIHQNFTPQISNHYMVLIEVSLLPDKIQRSLL